MILDMRIEKYISLLTGATVTKSRSGGAAGSMIKIEFSNNSTILTYCSWRVEHNERVLASSNDNIEAVNGLVAKTVKLLEGKKIKSIAISNQYDLIISFEEKYSLKLFCDISYSYSEYETSLTKNWELWIPYEDISFTVNNSFEVEEGKYY